MRYEYKPKGVCLTKITIEHDNRTITNVEFNGGCSGNLLALKKLIIGMTLEIAIEKFAGNQCGFRSTSCMDQFAEACKEILDGNLVS